jgi:hypothetical protein
VGSDDRDLNLRMNTDSLWVEYYRIFLGGIITRSLRVRQQIRPGFVLNSEQTDGEEVEF